MESTKPTVPTASLTDSNGEIISIVHDRSASEINITWRGSSLSLPGFRYYYWALPTYNFIKNFKWNEIDGIHLKIDDKHIYTLYEHIDKRTIRDDDGWTYRLTISGFPGYRKLEVVWAISTDFNRANSVHVSDNVTTADVKYGKILCHSQDRPHGIEMVVDGRRIEMTDNYSPPKFREMLINEIVDGDDEIGGLLAVVENNRVLDILEGTDTLKLAKEVDRLREQLKEMEAKNKLTAQELLNVQNKLRKAENEGRVILSELTTLRQERDTFKREVLNRVNSTLNGL